MVSKHLSSARGGELIAPGPAISIELSPEPEMRLCQPA